PASLHNPRKPLFCFFMQGPLPLFVIAALSAGLLTSCSKKAEVAPEPAAPQSQDAASAGATDASGQAAAPVRETPPGEMPAPVPAPGAGVSPAVAAADAAYEAWFAKYNLDLSDPDMLDADPDMDGVPNRDEFLADTNPRDAESHSKPADTASAEVHPQIRMQEFNELSLPVVLDSVDGKTANLKRIENGKMETVRAGETIKDLGLKVEDVQQRRGRDKHGEVFDGSRVILTDPATSQKTTLIKDMPTRSDASYAIFRSDDGKTTRRVRQGETFTWPGEEESTYKVIDLRPDQAVIQHMESGRMLTVPKS
ncbi:MAG: Amuc_1099 family pilus-like system protein, partial [Chthoniobacteraceae bacterium]